MNINMLLTPAGQGLPATGEGLKAGALPAEGVFAQLFTQTSNRAALAPGELQPTAGVSHSGLADSSVVHLPNGSTQPGSTLAPLAQGIAQANAHLGNAAGEPQLPEPIDSPIVEDLLDTEASQADLAALPVQDALDVIRERMALIKQAGLKPAETPSEPSMTLAANTVTFAPGGIATPGNQAPAATAPALAAIAGEQGSPGSQTRLPASESRYQQHVQQQIAVDEAALPSPNTPSPSSINGPATPASSHSAEALIAREASLMRRGQSSEGNAGSSVKEGRGIQFSGPMQGSAAPLATAATSQPAAAMISAPLASPQWQQQINQQLIGLHQRGGQQIELHLNPAELGPLSVSLKMTEQGAQAQFLSANAQVRSALEQAMPQLRDALNEQGIALGEAMVGDHSHQQQQQQQAESGAARRSPGSATGAEPHLAADDAAALTTPSLSDTSRVLDGRVDIYA